MIASGSSAESGLQVPPLRDTDSPEALSSDIPSNVTLESGVVEIRRGSGPQANDLAGDDSFHDLGRAAVASPDLGGR